MSRERVRQVLCSHVDCGMRAFFKIYQIGTPLSYVSGEIAVLMIFTIVGFVTSYVALRVRINENSKTKILQTVS